MGQFGWPFFAAEGCSRILPARHDGSMKDAGAYPRCAVIA
jgi:hypothetical protein